MQDARYIHTYIIIADTLESFPRVLFTRHRDGVLKFVCTDYCRAATWQTLSRKCHSTDFQLARKAVKFHCEMTARYQRLRLWTAALIFLMNIVAKVFRDKISTNSYSPWWTQRWGTHAVYSHRIKSRRVFRKNYAVAGIILRYSTEYSSLNLNGRGNQRL